MLEGEVIPLPDRRLRFELRRVDLARGLVRRAYQTSGTDRLALFDSITALIAADLGVAPPTGTLAEVSTSSPLAFRLYGEGLRAFYQFDSYAANRLFAAAVAEDSTFAMATYYAWRSARAINSGQQDRLAVRAIALASHASEHDRLLIRTHVGLTRWDLAAVPAAESLVARFPNDPEALTRAAEVTSDLGRATELLNRSIAIDSAAGVTPLAVCRLCEALYLLARRYDWADSVTAAEATMRRWIRLRPDDYAPWLELADYLVGLGGRTDAEAALQHADSLGAPDRAADERELLWGLRSDDVAAADAICRSELGADARSFARFRWLCTIALRMQGRYRDAEGLIHEGRAPGSSVAHRGLPPDRIHAAILDLEMGRPHAAATRFTRMAKGAEAAPRLIPGFFARNLAWALTLEGTAYAAAQDTVRVRLLADSVEATGRRSLFPRDPLLHHFLRGLLLAAAQQHEGAVGEFRAAMHSPSEGYTRINLELGRSLLALNRPAEAVPVLRAPLHGGVDGSGLYVTRTEMHELLARAFDAAGQRDSAAAHYAIVERAWRHADPFLAPRHEAARAWLARSGR